MSERQKHASGHIMSGIGFPRVHVSIDNDMKLNPAGKLCAPMGTKHLPGALNRSFSRPNCIMTCPGGSADLDVKLRDASGRRYHEELRNSLTLNASMAGTATFRPGTSGEARPGSSFAPGGGRSQGNAGIRPSSTGAIGYDPSKHSWCHPLGQAEYARLAGLTSKPSLEPQSWAWTMFKARDHNGYGDDGMVTWGDVQNTCVSADAPSWLVGTRSVPGPLSTKKFPVRRCPLLSIDTTGKLRVRAKTYQQGPTLNTIETLHDSETPAPRKTEARKKPLLDAGELPARHCHFEPGLVCQTKYPDYPTRGASRGGQA